MFSRCFAADKPQVACILTEQFRPFPSHPRYSIGDQGTVIGPRGHALTITRKWSASRRHLNGWRKRTYGQFGVSIRSDEGRPPMKMVYHHLAVLEAWHGPKPSPDAKVIWRDGDLTNCAASNLRWEVRS